MPPGSTLEHKSGGGAFYLNFRSTITNTRTQLVSCPDPLRRRSGNETRTQRAQGTQIITGHKPELSGYSPDTCSSTIHPVTVASTGHPHLARQYQAGVLPAVLTGALYRSAAPDLGSAAVLVTPEPRVPPAAAGRWEFDLQERKRNAVPVDPIRL